MKALAQILFEISCTQDLQILFSKGHNSEKGHNSDMKKNTGQLLFHENTYMKFQIPSIHRSKVSNFTEKWKNQSNFQNSIFLSKFDREFSKVVQVIYSSAPTSMPNLKALAQILFEITCTQDFQILFSKGHNSEKGHNSDMQKIRVNYFFMRNTYMKFQIPSMHHSEVNRRTDRQTDRQTDKPKAICPSNFFKVGGINMKTYIKLKQHKMRLQNINN